MKTKSILQLLNESKIVIPPIQRDYAQGRQTGRIPKIRGRFLDDIVAVLKDDKLPPLDLDFIYGYVEKHRLVQNEITEFKPLDGQQRLTTLFLVHWYIAHKPGELEADKLKEAKELLVKFTYATRKSTRDFCQELIAFTPHFDFDSVDKEIIDQPWFMSIWQSDPSILSMLIVLRDIEYKFKGLEKVWEKLTGDQPRIIFHHLPMDDLGLPDDLYIKMNARGKELTDFEHFKSQFSGLLDDDNAKLFNNKIDKEWSDLFWNIFRDKQSNDIAKEVDNGFLGFFWYITDLLINKRNIPRNGSFWLDTIKMVYYKSPDNVKFLFDSLNLFEKLEKASPDYFDRFLYIRQGDFDIAKTRIFFNNPQTNLFRKCAETYGFGDRNNTFSVGEQLFLYAFIFMQLKYNNTGSDKFRLLRNIFASSEDQLRNEYLSKFLYTDVEGLIENNRYSTTSKLSTRQFKEEERKNELIKNHPELKEAIYRLEDHALLRGNIDLIDIDEGLLTYSDQFQKIFISGCDYFSISKALLTFGDYTQSYGKYRRYGNKNNSTWRELFTQSENRGGFENTKNILKLYLDLFISDPEKSNESIIQEYIENYSNNPNLPKDMRYYIIKYNAFTFWDENQTDGFYWWNDFEKKPYECWMLFKRQFNGRHWSPFLLELKTMNPKCSLDNFGNELQYTNGDIILKISNLNTGFKFSAISDDEYSNNILSEIVESTKLNEDKILEIKQNEAGFDLEDRIVKCNDFLMAMDPLGN